MQLKVYELIEQLTDFENAYKVFEKALIGSLILSNGDEIDI